MALRLMEDYEIMLLEKSERIRFENEKLLENQNFN